LEEHQGGIVVESELGKGSTFKLFVPVADEQVTVQSTPEMSISVGSGSVLVVDDEQTLSSLLRQMLSELGYDVRAYIDPVEALEVFKENPAGFDLVIVDQSMPKLKGIELAEQVWSINENTKVVMLTGFSEDITPEEAVKRGCFRCLVKPVEFDVLANCVAEAMLG
jgi:DNA-binding NtrC family response regulator